MKPFLGNFYRHFATFTGHTVKERKWESEWCYARRTRSKVVVREHFSRTKTRQLFLVLFYGERATRFFVSRGVARQKHALHRRPRRRCRVQEWTLTYLRAAGMGVGGWVDHGQKYAWHIDSTIVHGNIQLLRSCTAVHFGLVFVFHRCRVAANFCLFSFLLF